MHTYDFKTLLRNGELTQAQFDLLSWYAYSYFMHESYNRKQEKYYWMYIAYGNACDLASIDLTLKIAVSCGNIKGLRNFNRLGTVEYYDRNIGSYSRCTQATVNTLDPAKAGKLFNINTGQLVAPSPYTFEAWLQGKRPFLIRLICDRN